jgi:DNA-binding transcriptional LysR family regulator
VAPLRGGAARPRAGPARQRRPRDLAAQPLITYTPEFAGRRKVDAAFAARGLAPEIALEAIDSDVIKTYVALGFGVGLIAGIAHDPQRDRELARIEIDRDALPVNVARLAVRAGAYLRDFERRFVEIATTLTPPGAAIAAPPGEADAPDARSLGELAA